MRLNSDSLKLMKKEIQERLGYKELMSKRTNDTLTLSLYKSTTEITKINIKAYTKSQGD